MRQSVDRFNAAYERARFADSGEDAELLPKLYDESASKPPNQELEHPDYRRRQ